MLILVLVLVLVLVGLVLVLDLACPVLVNVTGYDIQLLSGRRARRRMTEFVNDAPACTSYI